MTISGFISLFTTKKKSKKKWINYNKILRSDVEINLEKSFKEEAPNFTSFFNIQILIFI